MSDQTVYAEALIATVARAFYEDEAVCLIDVLIRDKYLRDDDMGPRLSLPARQLRKTLQFLQEEQLVKYEHVDDLSTGGSQATKYWYIDYNHAVNVIRLRIYLLRKKLEQAELRARSSSVYLCPGFKTKVCNGRYTETEAQQVLDPNTGLFLCQECVKAHAANPNPPPIETYTLQLVDNTRDLKLAMDNMRRVNVQLSAKMVGNHQLRAGIYDLLQKVRSKGKGPLTSNLPSENCALGIGSKRLAGTGRTAGIKAKKLAQQGVAKTAASVRKYLGGATRSEEGSDLTFLKNAMGQEVAFEVEKGGGARAYILATGGRKQSKLMDAAASRVGVDIPLEVKLRVARKKRAREEKEAEEEEKKNGDKSKKKKGENLPNAPSFLQNNIGKRTDEEEERARKQKIKDEEEEGMTTEEEDEEEDGLVIIDGGEELWNMDEEERRAAFQSQYKIEMARQLELLQAEMSKSDAGASQLDESANDEDDTETVAWEDG